MTILHEEVNIYVESNCSRNSVVETQTRDKYIPEAFFREKVALVMFWNLYKFTSIVRIL